MPDWRDESSYEFARKLTTHGWAWEFLRRNSNFLELWKEWRASREHLLAEFIEASGRLPPGSQLRDTWALPEAKPLQAFEGRLTAFGLKYWVEPEEPAHLAKSAFFIRLDVQPIAVYGDHMTLEKALGKEWPGYPFKLHLEFSLALPIETQLKVAKRELEQYRARAVKEGHFTPIEIPKGIQIRKREFLMYLRLLDGKLDGASIGELGRVLFASAGEPRKSAQKQLATAVQMTEVGYWRLMLEPEDPVEMG